MDLEPANGGTDELLRINGKVTVRDALSELIGSGHTTAVVEKDGQNGLLTFDAIEGLMTASVDPGAGEQPNGGERQREPPTLLLLQDLTGGSEFIDWEWLRENFWEDVVPAVQGHIFLSFVSIAIALVISLPVGVLSARFRKIYPPVTVRHGHPLLRPEPRHVRHPDLQPA